MNIVRQPSPNGQKLYIIYDHGRGKGGRVSSGMFLWAKPKNAIEKLHNKETEDILAVKQGNQVIDNQTTGTGYIPKHKFKENFFDYYEKYVKDYSRKGNRH